MMFALSVCMIVGALSHCLYTLVHDESDMERDGSN